MLADGKTTEKNLTSLNKDNLPNASFWVDMLGNAYLKGTIYATDGVFSGELKAATGTFSGELKAASGEFSGTVRASKFIGTMDVSDGELIGPAIYVPSKESPNFSVDSSGNVTIRGGNISFSALDQSTQDTINDKVDAGTVDSMIDAKMPTLPEYIKSTYIDFSQVATPTLIANYVRTLGQFQVGYGSHSVLLVIWARQSVVKVFMAVGAERRMALLCRRAPAR